MLGIQIQKNIASVLLGGFFSIVLIGTNSWASKKGLTFERDAIPDEIAESDTITETEVMQALAASKGVSPAIHEDALRVWKKFTSGRIEPNYSYYFWARNLILWLQKNRKIKFDLQESVAEVFSILQKKDLISADAEVVLTRFVWENIKRWGSLAPKERAMPQYRIEQKRIFVENLNETETQDNKK